ncbi:AAA family ATPase [Vibrio olivae]|uniref:AAA family ATPase n=1 Tax=Vibrio olivae TaxID=1243002 RepID=A0ABV5HJR0_9VIBR
MPHQIITTPKEITELQGVVTAILHKLTDGNRHSAIFSIVVDKTKYKVKASFGCINGIPAVGELWSIRGKHTSDLTYGSQFEASEGKRIAITEETDQSLVLAFIVYNSNFPGIGPSWAKKLDIAFKECLVKSLETANVSDLEHHPQLHMPHVMAELLLLGWKRCSAEIQIMTFLDDKAIPKDLSQKLMLYWGNNAVKTLSHDPYRLLPLMPVTSAKTTWRKIDKIAQEQFGVSEQDPRRAISAIEAYLYWVFDSGGHMCAPIPDVQGFLDQKGIQYDVHDVVNKHGQSLLLIHEKRNLVQNIGHFALEKIVSDKLNQLCHNHPSKRPLLLFNDSLRIRFEIYFKQKNELENFRLTKTQLNAIRLAMASRLSLITGGSGTGKTTTISAIVTQHESQDTNVWLLAPTGKAAKRLTEQTGHQAETIFSFVQKLYRRAHNSIIDNALVIIDDASMLDIPSAYSLLKWLPYTCRLCLVGDIKQLPPLGPGLVFHQLYKYKNLVSELSQTYRQKETSDLHIFCEAISQQELATAMSVLHPFSKDTRYQICYYEPKNLSHDHLCNLAANLWYEINKKSDTHIQLLTSTRDICDKLNAAIQKIKMSKNTSQRIIHNCIFVQGDLVIFEQNNSSIKISNGSTGIVKEVYEEYSVIDGRKCVVTINFNDEGYRHLTLEDCLWLKLAYCITAHKAQGSRYTHSIVVLDNPSLIDNSWLYTTSSLTLKSLLLIGNLDFIKKTISLPPKAYQRQIGYPVQIEGNFL